MMLALTILVILLTATWIFFSLYLRPKREYERIIRMFESKGFKVEKIPFKFLGAPVYEGWEKNLRLYGDCLKK